MAVDRSTKDKILKLNNKFDKLKNKSVTLSLRTTAYNKEIIHERAQDKGISDNAYLSEIIMAEIRDPRSYDYQMLHKFDDNDYLRILFGVNNYKLEK